MKDNNKEKDKDGNSNVQYYVEKKHYSRLTKILEKV